MLDKLAAVEARYEELGREMARPELTCDYERLQGLAREHSSLEDVVTTYRELRRPAPPRPRGQGATPPLHRHRRRAAGGGRRGRPRRREGAADRHLQRQRP